MRLTRLLATLRLRLRAVLNRRRVEQELNDELRDHIERSVAADVARGLPAHAARQAALAAFGGLEQSREACRDARRVNFVEHTIQDIRFAMRHFARAPIVTATIIGIFALGIGLSTVPYLFVNAFVSGPLPGVPHHDALVRIRGIDRTQPGRAIGREFSYPEYQQYAAERALFSDVAAWTSSDIVFDVSTGDPNPQSGAATYVTSRYFQVLGLRLSAGAGLPTDGHDAEPAPPVAVISDLLWERHFDRAPDVVGRTMKVNGVTVTIVGVAPRRFAGARIGGSSMRVWMPLSARPEVQHTASTLATYEARFGLVARLQPGVRLEATAPTVEAIARRVAEESTAANVTASTDVVPLLGGNYFPPPGTLEEPSAGPWMALIFPVLVLLITCTNVSALLAGLGVVRQREIAVRLALGAGRRRIIRQLMTETVLLALAAGALGLSVIWLLWRLFDANIPDLAIEIDWPAIALTFALSLAAGLLFGFAPALHATRVVPQKALKDSAGIVVARRLRLQSTLVVAQIAFTQPALLAMGAVLLEMREDLRDMPDQQFADRLLELEFNVNPRYGALDEVREQSIGRVQERLAALPGVVGVVRQENDDSFDVEVHPEDAVPGLELNAPLQVETIAAPEGYFELTGVMFERGRDFNGAERSQEGAVVVGSRMARRLWGGADAVGRRLTSVGPNMRNTRTFTIIGVVDDRTTGTREQDVARIFMSRVHTTGHLLVRTQGPANELLPAIRAAAVEAAPALPIVSAQTLAAGEARVRRSVLTAISAAGGVGGTALLLSAIGLYAVVAFGVGQRVREIGIRTALGAEHGQVVRLFIRRGLRLGVIGLVLGLALGLGGVRIISAAQGSDPPAGTLPLAALVAVFVIAVAFVASWIPARRAAHVDPLDALRMD